MSTRKYPSDHEKRKRQKQIEEETSKLAGSLNKYFNKQKKIDVEHQNIEDLDNENFVEHQNLEELDNEQLENERIKALPLDI